MIRFMVSQGMYATLAVAALIALVDVSRARCETPGSETPGDPPFSSRLITTGSTTTAPVIWHDDFEQGWKAAKASGRPMLIFITSRRCHFCEAMKKTTWCDGQIQRELSKGFVAIRLSPGQNATVLKRIEVPAYPTTLIGHPDGKILAHKVGYQPPKEMFKLLKRNRLLVH